MVTPMKSLLPWVTLRVVDGQVAVPITVPSSW
jgi:hypothetical protein